MELKQIYDISGLKLKFGSKKALEINTLKFHNGLIYGVCGNFGSGKSSLLKILSGIQKESNGDCLLYTSPSPRDATLSRMPSSA